MRVLVVEDERIIARDLRQRLSRLGYEVTGLAFSKTEAVALAEDSGPDLVLMDIQLNGLPEGIDAAEEIRDRFDIPVIYLTSHSDSKTLARAKLTGPFGYILKPFDDRELVVVIETAAHKHESERVLRDSEQRLRLAQMAGEVGVFDWNIETGRVVVTPELEEIFGIPMGCFGGTYEAWAECIHPEDRRAALEAIERWKDSDGLDERWELRILRPDGEVRWVETRGRLHRNKAGRVIRILGAQLDITDRKLMEEALRQKEREAQRSNEDLQAYAYTVSHDLREPLRAIACCTGLLEQECGERLNETGREYLSLVASGARRMNGMVAGLLEFSRVGLDSSPMSLVDCNEVLAAVLASLSIRIEETGARLLVAPLPKIRAWEGRLNQLFQNLIENSLKYRTPGVPPRIEISAEKQDGEWRFIVKDNGIGFDMRDAGKIFVVFKRLYANEYDGAGIGLSVCKRIVERHGGRIWAESKLQEGASFFFTLPERLNATAQVASGAP